MASRKTSSRKKKKTPARKRQFANNKNGVTFRPTVQRSRKTATIDVETFGKAIDKLGPETVARIVGATTRSVNVWARDLTKIPKGYASFDVELSLTMRRLSYMERRAANVQNVNAKSRKVYFNEYIALASKSRLTSAENARIVKILLKLGIDPHRPESYLRGAT